MNLFIAALGGVEDVHYLAFSVGYQYAPSAVHRDTVRQDHAPVIAIQTNHFVEQVPEPGWFSFYVCRRSQGAQVVNGAEGNWPGRLRLVSGGVTAGGQNQYQASRNEYGSQQNVFKPGTHLPFTLQKTLKSLPIRKYQIARRVPLRPVINVTSFLFLEYPPSTVNLPR